jgi:putative pyruvate formate lyase activating enzyme
MGEHSSVEKQPTHPSYLYGVDFQRRIGVLNGMLAECTVCPFHCGVDRRRRSEGRCRSGILPKIASWNLHHGEEPPISGIRGSGTIFFSGCSFRCVFCQNYPISQMGHGNEITVAELADRMLLLQKKGAHNINLVTPTHFVPQIVEAVAAAAPRGLRIPLVYNSNGFDDVETLKLLEGIVDIYLPDMKYGDDSNAKRYSGVSGYVEKNRAAVTEMYRQVGELRVDAHGIAKKGLIIRHLVLPGNEANTQKVLEFIALISPSIPVSLMSQYFPAYRAHSIPKLKRKLPPEEYQHVKNILVRLGIENGWIQPID